MKWIKITERVPKIPKNDMCIRILMYTDEGIYTGNFWNDESWYVDCFGKVDVEEVLYWMPLPKLPKED